MPATTTRSGLTQGELVLVGGSTAKHYGTEPFYAASERLSPTNKSD